MNREIIIDKIFPNICRNDCLKYYTYDNSLKDIKLDDFWERIEEIIKRYTCELEAKVYTYEKVIANSNFKSILSKDKQTLEKRVKELEKEIIELKGEDNE